jgi:hypothetical protein
LDFTSFLFFFWDSGYVGDEKSGGWFEIQIDVEVLLFKIHTILYSIVLRLGLMIQLIYKNKK